jgi:hypothetical protein
LRKTDITRALDVAGVPGGVDDVKARRSENDGTVYDQGRENLDRNAVNFLKYVKTKNSNHLCYPEASRKGT